MKKYQKQLISLFAGAVPGYLIYYYFFIEVLALFFTDGFFYLAISIAVLIMCVVGCAAMIYVIWQKRISKWMLILLITAYMAAMAVVLFGRSQIGRIAVLNPLIGLSELNNLEMLVESLLNLALFIPVGFFFRNKKPGKVILWALIISIGIEAVQYVTMRGIFDTLDIILYMLGIGLGAIIFCKLKLKIE